MDGEQPEQACLSLHVPRNFPTATHSASVRDNSKYVGCSFHAGSRDKSRSYYSTPHHKQINPARPNLMDTPANRADDDDEYPAVYLTIGCEYPGFGNAEA